MLVGVDFDNTIVCYDRLFYAVALEEGLIPAALPVSKSAVRDYLRAAGREDDWTELQGVVYGRRIGGADAFPGVLGFFIRCREQGVPVCIVSHKTRAPYRGQACDLHEAARGWLRAQGFHDSAGAGLPESEVYLELTKDEKLQRIGALGCTHFVDDLPEFLAEPAFPAGVERILFDPNGQHRGETRFRRAESWEGIRMMIWQDRGRRDGG